MTSSEEFQSHLIKIKSLAQNEFSGDMFYDTLGELLVRERVCANHEDVRPLLEELFRFLYLSVKCDNINPPSIIDAAWRVLLQLPLYYAKICSELYKVPLDSESFRVIDRNPFFADNSYAHERRCQKYVAEYVKYFGASPPELILQNAHRSAERCQYALQAPEATTQESYTDFRDFAHGCCQNAQGGLWEILGEVLMREKLCRTAENADIIMEELLRFLLLKSKHPDVLPTDIVCQAWWKLLLLPQYYIVLCKYLREGKPAQHQIIDYNPLTMDNKYAVERRRETYIKYYEEMFGTSPPKVKLVGVRRSASPSSSSSDSDDESADDSVAKTDDSDIAPSKTMKNNHGLRVQKKSVPLSPPKPVDDKPVLQQVEKPKKEALQTIVQNMVAAASPQPQSVKTPTPPSTNGQTASQAHQSPPPARPLGPTEKLVIFVQEDGKATKLSFKLLATTPMKAVIENYATKMKLPVGSLRFTANGRIVTETDTALTLGLENSGVITATFLNVMDVN